ncbi:MAG TPA: bifunctional acetate--CoA ligase family protein/GNAT family N-acetyltransferase [Roseiflexaceae bacterium]|nr:bifunctional acetate--CoA ligase family protein/GNAT family N-acetyltransferase [Roseiflexaceae bacterium]
MQTATTSAPITESVHTILRRRGQPLDVFFTPETVAVIGASNTSGSVGRTVLWNLISHPFGGTVFPINPKHPSVLGIQAYPTIAHAPAPIDLAVVVTPAPTVPGIIGQCADAGVRGAIIVSAGFKETGVEGAELERQVLREARRTNMRLLGPNCLGVMRPLNGVNATFAKVLARPGNVGFISQSGALCTAVLDWSLRENVGFSAFVSIGSMLDVGWGDLIDYLGDDPQTQSIVIYMESIGDARSFLSAAREVALTKPIIVLKTGRTTAAAQAAASHTGALVGSDAVLDAALRRCGVLRVDSIADLFDMAEVLAKQPRPQGPRLAILTNAGGPGVLATDALVKDGGRLAELAPTTIEALGQLLPAHWSQHNPVDILGDATPERYANAVDIVARDPNSDGLLVILTPQAMTCPAEVANCIIPIAQRTGKPLLASWMGGADVAEGEAILNRANIPTYAYPDTAARAFQYMWRYSENLHSLYETPVHPLEDAVGAPDRALAARVIQLALDEGRSLLTEAESKQLLGAYGIPTVETRTAASQADAVKCADALGYPVVLKLWSTTITHKTDVDGVRLGLRTAAEVRRAYRAIAAAVEQRVGAQHFLGVTVQPMIISNGYELILGSSLDSQFGPVLLFGSGGQLVEVLEDRALALPPLTSTLARHMIERTHIFKALAGIRGRKPVDLAALEELLVRFSLLVAEQRRIAEIDINPLLAAADRLIALDARVVLHGADVAESTLPRLAIRPYPTQYVAAWMLNDGTPITIRPIRPEDEPLMVAFHQTLSEESVYLRYFYPLGLSQRVTHERLIRICFTDYDREIALVAEHQEPASGVHEIIAVGRLMKLHGSEAAEFALLISDRFQRRGLGSELLRRLLDVGRAEKIHRIVAEILPENTGMLRICQRLGFQLRRSIEEPVKAVIKL